MRLNAFKLFHWFFSIIKSSYSFECFCPDLGSCLGRGSSKSPDGLRYVHNSVAEPLSWTKPWKRISLTLVHLRWLSVETWTAAKASSSPTKAAAKSYCHDRERSNNLQVVLVVFHRLSNTSERRASLVSLYLSTPFPPHRGADTLPPRVFSRFCV